MYVTLYNLTAPQTFYCLLPVMQAQNSMCNSSSVRCTREEQLHRMDVQKLNARQVTSAARAREVSVDAVCKRVGESSSGSRKAWLLVCPCERAVGGWCCGYWYGQGQGEAVRLARSQERVPSPGSNFELNPQNKGICLWYLWGCGQGDVPCICQRN